MEKTKSDKKIKKRITSQQRIVLDFVKSVKIHPSAETIYEKVRKKLPQISLGTVYRNLAALKARNEILEIPLKSTSRYDGDTSSHSHFICEECESITDLASICSDVLKCEKLGIQKLKIGNIKNYQLNFYGICSKCNLTKNKFVFLKNKA